MGSWERVTILPKSLLLPLHQTDVVYTMTIEDKETFRSHCSAIYLYIIIDVGHKMKRGLCTSLKLKMDRKTVGESHILEKRFEKNGRILLVPNDRDLFLLLRLAQVGMVNRSERLCVR